MPWGPVRGHDPVVEELRRGLAAGRFPHALLFVGPEGVGKRLFAQRLAQTLLCEVNPPERMEPCGQCPSCRQVPAETHPDVLMVARPEDKHELPIELIRQLNHDLALKPMRGSRRVAIVDDADALSEEAANAFLKTLEEPPPGSALILIGTSAELQLDTILSRCRVVRFEPLAHADLVEILLDQHIAGNRAEADALATRADGQVSRALGLADPELDAFRQGLIESLVDARGFSPPALTRRIEGFVNEAGKESTLRRARASLIVGELARFFRGVLWQTAGLSPPCPDPRDRRAAESLAEQLDPEDVFVLADRCLQADYQIARRANLPLILEALTHDLGKLINRRS